MTHEQGNTELGRRAVACKGWRWLGGMVVLPESHPRERWVIIDCDGTDAWMASPTQSKSWGGAGRDWCDLSDGWVPDLEHPATLGCLLALVRETHGAVFAWLVEGSWYVRSADRMDADISEADTEAGALVAALEGAP